MVRRLRHTAELKQVKIVVVQTCYDFLWRLHDEHSFARLMAKRVKQNMVWRFWFHFSLQVLDLGNKVGNRKPVLQT